MAEDPSLPLTDVQSVLGHAQLTTTQIYLTPRHGGRDPPGAGPSRRAAPGRQRAAAPARAGLPARDAGGAVRDGALVTAGAGARAAACQRRRGCRGTRRAAGLPRAPRSRRARMPRDWPATLPAPRQVLGLLRRRAVHRGTPAPATLRPAVSALLLDWLEDQPGEHLAAALAGQRRRPRRGQLGGSCARLAGRPRRHAGYWLDRLSVGLRAGGLRRHRAALACAGWLVRRQRRERWPATLAAGPATRQASPGCGGPATPTRAVAGRAPGR